MRRDMGLIVSVFFLHFVRYGVVFPLVPLLAQDMGATAPVIGFVAGAFSLLAVFLSVPVGGLTDRFGLKRMLILGALCNMASSVLLLQARSVMILISAQLMGGLAFLLYVVSCQAYVSGLADPSRRERGFGYLTFGASAGQTLGPVIGGAIVNQFGYHAAFLAVLAISAAGLAVFRLQEVKRPDAVPSYDLRANIRDTRFLLADSRMLVVLAFTFVITFAVSLLTSFFPVLLRGRGLSETLVGLLISIFSGAATLVRPLVGWLLTSFSRKRLLAFSLLTAIVSVGTTPLLSTWTTLALALGLFGIGFGLSQPLSMVMVADLTHPDRSGLAMGLRFTGLTLANLFGPVILGFAVEGFGLPAAFYLTATFIAATGAYILMKKSHLLPGRRIETNPTR